MMTIQQRSMQKSGMNSLFDMLNAARKSES